MRQAFSSVGEFAHSAMELLEQRECSLATLDFNHVSYFNNVFGSPTVASAVIRSRKMLYDALLRMERPFVTLYSSGDEILVLCGSSEPQTLAQLLRRVQGAIGEECRTLFDGSAVPFGFTATVSSPVERHAWSPGEVLRALADANEEAIGRLKGEGRRGEASICEARSLATVDQRFPGVAELVWSSVKELSKALRTTARCTLPYEIFWQRAKEEASRSSLLFLIRPLFGGELFESVREGLDGGIEVLPDGRRVGKLGFLNRVLGHLTSSLFSEFSRISVLESLLEGAAPGGAGPPFYALRQAATLFVWLPAAGSSPDLSEWLIRMHQARRSVNDRFGPALSVDRLQVAAIPGTPGMIQHAANLNQRLLRLTPPAFHDDGAVALYQYSESDEGAFAERARLHAEWSIAALRNSQGAGDPRRELAHGP